MTELAPPSRALIFALDISKTNTGVVVLSVPFYYPSGPDTIRVIEMLDIRATAVAQGSQRVWWPTAKVQYQELREIIQYHRRKKSDHWPCVVYEGAAWGSATSEMMVYLQQRLFEYLDSDPDTNLDLFGFTAHFARSVARKIFGVPHQQAGKTLARMIYAAAVRDEFEGTIVTGLREKASQDIKDAFCLGVAAFISTTQFLRMQLINGEYTPHYRASEEYFAEAATRPYPNNRLDPFNHKDFLKAMAKRDEPHLSLTNPYLMPTRSLRLQQGAAYKPLQPSDYPGYLIATEGGLGKVGSTLYPTLVHDHIKQ